MHLQRKSYVPKPLGYNYTYPTRPRTLSKGQMGYVILSILKTTQLLTPIQAKIILAVVYTCTFLLCSVILVQLTTCTGVVIASLYQVTFVAYETAKASFVAPQILFYGCMTIPDSKWTTPIW